MYKIYASVCVPNYIDVLFPKNLKAFFLHPCKKQDSGMLQVKKANPKGLQIVTRKD